MKTLFQLREAHTQQQLVDAKKKHTENLGAIQKSIKRHKDNAETTKNISQKLYPHGPKTNEFFAKKLTKAKRKLYLTHKALTTIDKMEYKKLHPIRAVIKRLLGNG